MPVQTFEAVTDASGNIQIADAARLPAYTKVYVVVPEQTTSFANIMPQPDTASPEMLRIPFVRVMEEGLAKQLIKTIVEDVHAEL